MACAGACIVHSSSAVVAETASAKLGGVVTTYNQSRDHGEQRLGSYLNTLKSEYLCATSLDRDTLDDLGGPETVPGTFLASSDDLGDSAILHGRS